MPREDLCGLWRPATRWRVVGQGLDGDRVVPTLPVRMEKALRRSVASTKTGRSLAIERDSCDRDRFDHSYVPRVVLLAASSRVAVLEDQTDRRPQPTRRDGESRIRQ